MRSEVTDDSADRDRRDEEVLGLRAMMGCDLSVGLLATVDFQAGGGTKTDKNPVM